MVDDSEDGPEIVITVLLAALFFATEADATEVTRDRCFMRAEAFVAAAKARYGAKFDLS